MSRVSAIIYLDDAGMTLTNLLFPKNVVELRISGLGLLCQTVTPISERTK